MALDFLNKQAGITETTQDRIGTGSFTVDSGIYPAKITKAYLQQAASSKAVSIIFEFALPDSKTLTETVWVTNKTGENFYVDKKSNKPAYLPGFELASNIAFVAIGKELAELTPEPKVIEIYNSELKKKAPTTVQMLMDLVEKEIIVGVQKVLEFKQAKNQVTGAYEDTAETRESNEIVNVFTLSGLTALEVKSGAKEVDFINKFKEVYTSDYLRDKTKKAGNKPAGAQSPNQGVTTPSLFGAK